MMSALTSSVWLLSISATIAVAGESIAAPLIRSTQPSGAIDATGSHRFTFLATELLDDVGCLVGNGVERLTFLTTEVCVI